MEVGCKDAVCDHIGFLSGNSLIVVIATAPVERQGAVIDNGRVLSADYLEITITDVDYRIIVDEYNFTSIRLFDTYIARYGDLPPVYKAVICEYYKRKTTLKDVEGEEIAYIKSKNKLNSKKTLLVVCR